MAAGKPTVVFETVINGRGFRIVQTAKGDMFRQQTWATASRREPSTGEGSMTYSLERAFDWVAGLVASGLEDQDPDVREAREQLSKAKQACRRIAEALVADARASQ